MLHCRCLAVALAFVSATSLVAAPVQTSAALVDALRQAKEGDVVEVAVGTFELAAPLEIKPRVTLRGAGIDKTILTHTAGWKASPAGLPDPEVKTQGLDASAYLVRVQDRAAGVAITDLTIQAPQLHGAIYGAHTEGLLVQRVRVKETMWAGIRTLFMKGAKILDCEFIDAGGRWEKGGKPGVKGGITAGGIFAAWMADTEIAHNRFTRTRTAKEHEFYGIKVRQGKKCRIHHNTIEVNFSIEMPFENDEDVEIDHNICTGTISIPKHAGGPVPASGRTFHIHHNWMRDTYSIEFVRNGVEIDHNLFDFDVAKDHGNLISGFGKAAAKGQASFHNNLVRNPGRGVIWINKVFNNLTVRNNHILTNTTATPRKDGLFGFNRECDFSTIAIRDNLIECVGESRPLLRNMESYAVKVENNTLTNVADAAKLTNPKADRPIGLEAPLKFDCGVHGEVTVDGWTARKKPKS